MKKWMVLWCTLVFVFLGGVLVSADTEKAEKKTPEKPTLIAHGGGAVYGYRYTNSKEALEKSVKAGFQYIELDFNYTSDGKIVLIHDWEKMMERLFMTEERQLTLEEFLTMPTLQNLKLLDAKGLFQWMNAHTDVSIVVDAKVPDHMQLYRDLAEAYPKAFDRLIPQAYSLEEYSALRQMGYKRIILTLYMMEHPDFREITMFMAAAQPFGVTMSEKYVDQGLSRMLYERDVTVFVHTINDLFLMEDYASQGVYGYYTDYMEAGHFDAPAPWLAPVETPETSEPEQTQDRQETPAPEQNILN